MIQYVIATHGRLAEGFLSALRLFVGEGYQIDTICAYLDDETDETMEVKWERHRSTYSPEDEIVVFTDLYGGSVNQFFTGLLMKGCPLHVITGVNLGLMAELVIGLTEPVTEQAVQAAISQAKDGLCDMNRVVSELMSDKTEVDE